MKNRKIILQLLPFVFFVFLFHTAVFANQYKVIKVVDGDTIKIDIDSKIETIRFLNVNTPESVHPDSSKNTELGKKASYYTKSRLTDKFVALEFEGQKRGKYGRLLAYIFVDGINFNLELVQNGWSPYYTKYGKSEKYHSQFVEAEKYAKENMLNIWR